MSGNDPIKVYDARWEVGEFTDVQVRRLFEATFLYGRQLGIDTVCLTRDARLAAGHVLELGLDEAMRAGLRVFLIPDPISTPHAYFAAHHLSQKHPATMGLAVTASHNPSNYVGIKFTVPPVQAIGFDCGPMGGLTKVREIYHSSQRVEPRGEGTLELMDVREAYVAYSLQLAGVAPGDLKGLRVVLDAFNGSAGPELYAALQLAGAEVVAHRLVPDGTFPTGSPNPTSQGKMDHAVSLAARHDAAAVVGLDGDGDRLVFGDRRGILTAGFAFVPILRACREQAPGGTAPPVLYDPKVSPLALAEWGRLGTRPTLFRNGHSQIKDYMTQIGALAAAEESGHYYHRLPLGDITISAENSIVTTLLFLRAIRRDAGTLAELWRMQDQIFTTGEFNYQFDSDATRDAALSEVIAALVAEGAGTVTATPDGIDLQGTCVSKGVVLDPSDVSLAPGWYSGYLRVATNEKHVVRSYFSAGDEPSGRRVEQLAREILQTRYRGKVID